MRIANILLFASAVVSSVSAATVVQRGSEQKNLRFRKLPGRQSKNKTRGGIAHTGPHVETTTDEQQKESTKQRTGRGRGGRHRDGTIDSLTASLEMENEQEPNQRKGGRPPPSGLEPRTKGLVDTDGSMPTKEQTKSQSTPKEQRTPPTPKPDPEPEDTPVDTPEDTPLAGGGEGDSESESEEPHVKGAHKGPKLSHEERAEKHMKKMEEKKAKKAGEVADEPVDDATSVPPPIPEDTPVEDTPVEDEPDIVVDEPENEPVPEAFGGELLDNPEEEDNGTLDDVGGWELTNTFAPTLAPTWVDDETAEPTWVDVEEEEVTVVEEEVPTSPEIKECPAAYDTTGATAYVGGDKVEVTSHIFECHSLYVDYCNVPEWDDSMGGEVEEQMWNDAWTYIEPCVIGE